MDWRHAAACLDEDPELFFAIGNTGPAVLQIEEAKAVCRRCDVVETCLRWALDTGQDAGVWGGLSEDERRAEKRRRSRRKHKHPNRPSEYVPTEEAAEFIKGTRLNNRQVADRTGMHEDTVSDIRRCKNEWVHVDTMRKLRDGLAAVTT